MSKEGNISQFDAGLMREYLKRADMVLKWFGHDMPTKNWTEIKSLSVSRYATFKSHKCQHKDCQAQFKVCIMFRHGSNNLWSLTDHFLQCDGISLIDISPKDKQNVLARKDIKPMYCGRIATLF